MNRRRCKFSKTKRRAERKEKTENFELANRNGEDDHKPSYDTKKRRKANSIERGGDFQALEGIKRIAVPQEVSLARDALRKREDGGNSTQEQEKE